ncbi:hypothetical protein LC612_41080 [Nostoc sp. CHAB 5834]|nr:hypothetical protein [Nostoc sp. CHAB 5834]
MSTPISANENNALNDLVPSAERPIKPFRMPVPRKDIAPFNIEVLRNLYNDSKELKRAIQYGVMALSIIIGSIVAKTPFTYASLAVMVIAIFGFALVNTWNAILLFLVYLALEGMYKYTSSFSPLVYIIAPLLSVSIFIAWRIRTRAEAEHKEKTEVVGSPVNALPFRSTPRNNEIGLPKIAPLIFGLIALSFLQVANPEVPDLISAFNGAVVWYLGPISFFFIAYYSLSSRKEVIAFVYTLLVTGFVVSAYAVFQFNMGKPWVDAHVPGMSNMAAFDYRVGSGDEMEVGSYRPPSTASIAGGYIVSSAMAMLTALCVGTMPRIAVWKRVPSLLSLSVLTMGIVVSGVRQTVLNLVVVIPVLLSFSVRRFEDAIRLYFMMFMVGSLLLVSFAVADIAGEGKFSKRYGSVLTGNPLESYASNRGGALIQTFEQITLRPFGIGIRRGTMGQQVQVRGQGLGRLNNRETQWNCIHLDLGVFAVFLLAGCFGVALYQGGVIVQRLQDPNLRYLAAVMYTIILFTFIASLGSPILQSNYVFWSACGILFAIPRVAATERKMLISPPESITGKAVAPEIVPV